MNNTHKLDLQKNKEEKFKDMLRIELNNRLNKYGYLKSFDNEDLKIDDEKRWVFQLRYNGKMQIEICNHDWRDYTEYFHLKIDSKEILLVNILDYDELNIAFDTLYEEIEKHIK